MKTPQSTQVADAFVSFWKTIAALRDPKTGCPWDLAQDHQTLRRFMLEEGFEAVAAMTKGKPAEVCDELGDVLLQVVLNAQVAQDRGDFSIVDVIKAIDTKMHHRHPHVFDPNHKMAERSPDDVHAQWKKIKKTEQGDPAGDLGGRVFAAADDNVYPAVTQAQLIGKIAGRIGFDWKHPGEVFDQLVSEIEELRREVCHGKPDKNRIADEIGDVLFTLAQLCRHSGLDLEIVGKDANRKFLSRFERLEDLATSRGIDVRRADQPTLEGLWRDVKKQEHE